jgi:hypothetical protein
MQRWRVVVAVQFCRRVRDPALAPAVLANIAYRRTLLAFTYRRGFIALRIWAALLAITITVVALIGHQPPGHAPPLVSLVGS